MSITLPGVPEGWELVRHGLPREGESFVGDRGNIQVAQRNFTSHHSLIVRKIWTMPKDLKLKPGRIFMNFGDWYWTSFECKPLRDRSSGFYSVGSRVVNLSESTNFVGPDVTPENSLIEIA